MATVGQEVEYIQITQAFNRNLQPNLDFIFFLGDLIMRDM
jgi:hypothetical protein